MKNIENLTQTTLSLVFCPNLNSGKLARCKGRVRLPARDTNSSGDDDDDDGAVDALSPSKKRGTKMNTTTSDFQEASKGKLEKLELIFDTYHGTMIRKKRCVRGWNLSSCCICTFDQPRSSPSWSNSNLLKIIYPKPRCHEIPYKMHANTFKRGKNECRMGPLRWRNEHVVERIT